MGSLKEKTIALLNKYGVFFDANVGRWITTEELLEKRYGVRFDDNDGRWVTTENDNRVHISAEGVPDKGNPFVLAVMKGEDPKKVRTRSAREAGKAKIQQSNSKMKELRDSAKPKMEEVENWKRNVSIYEERIESTDKMIEEYKARIKQAEEKRDRELAELGYTREEAEKKRDDLKEELYELSEWFDSNGISCYFDRNDPAGLKEEADQKRKRHTEASNEFFEIEGIFSRSNLDVLQESQKRQESYKETYEEKLNNLRNNDPTEALNRVREEYDQYAKERDAAVLDAFPTPKDCETSEDVNDYIRARGYIRGDGESALESDTKVDIGKMKVDRARALAEQLDKLAEDYPWFNGRFRGLSCDPDDPGTLGSYHPKTGMVNFAEGYYGESGDIEGTFEKNVASGFHPQGVDYRSIVDHEMTHAMEDIINDTSSGKQKAADIVMRRVAKRMGLSASPEDQQTIREMVSRYAGHNYGAYRDRLGKLHTSSKYGKNTEFLAEAMSEARCSENPREVSAMVREEFEKLMRERGLEVKQA